MSLRSIILGPTHATLCFNFQTITCTCSVLRRSVFIKDLFLCLPLYLPFLCRVSAANFMDSAGFCDTVLIRPTWWETLWHIICYFPVQQSIFSFDTSGWFFFLIHGALGSDQTDTVGNVKPFIFLKLQIPFTTFPLGASCACVIKMQDFILCIAWDFIL